MNFLFSTVLIFLLTAPALVFFRAYYSGAFSIRYSRLTITDQIFKSVIPGLTLQAIAIFLLNFIPPGVSLTTLATFLLGAKEDSTLNIHLDILSHSWGRILIYHLVMVSLGAVAGWQTRKYVRRKKLDRKYRWLRFDNNWHYLLTGEIIETADVEFSITDAEEIDFVVVDALVEYNKSGILYTGVLVQYELAEDGGLKSICLNNANRKSLYHPEDDLETPDKISSEPVYHGVKGDLLIIPYDNILNLNITYYTDFQVNAPSDEEDEIEVSSTATE